MLSALKNCTIASRVEATFSSIFASLYKSSNSACSCLRTGATDSETRATILPLVGVSFLSGEHAARVIIATTARTAGTHFDRLALAILDPGPFTLLFFPDHEYPVDSIDHHADTE